MKQFSLEEYFKNPSKKVITRNGKNVKIHCTNYNRFKPIIAEIEGTNTSYSFTIDGRFYNNDESRNDLFFAPEKHEGWINIYHNSEGAHYVMVCPIFESKEEAEKTGKRYINYMTTIKIEWEE